MGIFKDLNERLQIFLEDKFAIQEMANFRGGIFNLPVNVWIDGPREMKHGKRIKIQNNYSTNFMTGDLISITISEDPQLGKTFNKIKIKTKDIEKVKKWIIQNKQVLESYADGQLGTDELIKLLKPLQ